MSLESFLNDKGSYGRLFKKLAASVSTRKTPDLSADEVGALLYTLLSTGPSVKMLVELGMTKEQNDQIALMVGVAMADLIPGWEIGSRKATH